MKKILLIVLCVFCVSQLSYSGNWDGVSSDTSWYNPSENEFHISSASELKGFSDLVNSGEHTFEGATVYLEKDIDLNGKSWIPIGYGNHNFGNRVFKGVFNGNGFKVSNLYIRCSDLPYMGGINTISFFGNSKGVISNLRLDGEIYVDGNTFDSYYIGGIVSKGDSIIDCFCDVDINFLSSYYYGAICVVGIAAGEINYAKGVRTSGGIYHEDTYNSFSKRKDVTTFTTIAHTIPDDTIVPFFISQFVGRNFLTSVTDIVKNPAQTQKIWYEWVDRVSDIRALYTKDLITLAQKSDGSWKSLFFSKYWPPERPPHAGGEPGHPGGHRLRQVHHPQPPHALLRPGPGPGPHRRTGRADHTAGGAAAQVRRGVPERLRGRGHHRRQHPLLPAPLRRGPHPGGGGRPGPGVH